MSFCERDPKVKENRGLSTFGKNGVVVTDMMVVDLTGA